LLYSKRFGKLIKAQVHHTPYLISSLTLESCEETLTRAKEISAKPYEHFAYSKGVDVEVYAPFRV